MVTLFCLIALVSAYQGHPALTELTAHAEGWGDAIKSIQKQGKKDAENAEMRSQKVRAPPVDAPTPAGPDLDDAAVKKQMAQQRKEFMKSIEKGSLDCYGLKELNPLINSEVDEIAGALDGYNCERTNTMTCGDKNLCKPKADAKKGLKACPPETDGGLCVCDGTGLLNKCRCLLPLRDDQVGDGNTLTEVNYYCKEKEGHPKKGSLLETGAPGDFFEETFEHDHHSYYNPIKYLKMTGNGAGYFVQACLYMLEPVIWFGAGMQSMGAKVFEVFE